MPRRPRAARGGRSDLAAARLEPDLSVTLRRQSLADTGHRSHLAELPRRGVRAVTVMCPGFAADCLETLEEIALTGRDIFLQAGGERFDYVPALNARSDHAGALARLICCAASPTGRRQLCPCSRARR